MRFPPPTSAMTGTSIRTFGPRRRSVNTFQKLGERIFILVTRRRPRREGTAQRSGDSRLVRQAVDTDELAFHLVLGCVLM